jgi:hypothetical protein
LPSIFLRRNDFHLAVSRLFKWVKIPQSNTVKDGYRSDSYGFFYSLNEAARQHSIPFSNKHHFLESGAAQWGRKANF